MGAKRKRYTPRYRQDAAHLVLDTGRTIAEVAAEIGVGAQLLGRWVAIERPRMVELLGVSRSGYHAWTARQGTPARPRAVRAADLTVKIKVAHDASDGVNRAPRILADLREAGEVVSRKTVAKLMRNNNIRGISPRPWAPVTTLPDTSTHSIPDLVQRRFDRGVLNPVWTSDITYLTTGQGWLLTDVHQTGSTPPTERRHRRKCSRQSLRRHPTDRQSGYSSGTEARSKKLSG